MNDYYVYVYIDPRNFEEFYYGKGRGSRKDAHLSDASDSGKAKRIRAIEAAGLEPVVRVIAADLTEEEALLVESTLLWKLGRFTENVASGHLSRRFRPPDTLHTKLSGFDFQSGIYYYNVGEGPHRNWDDYRRYGFISAGQGARWRDAMLGFKAGDVVVAYLKRHGFVGAGRVLEPARPVADVKVGGLPLLSVELKCRNLGEHADDPELAEHVALVAWIESVPREEAKWQSNAGLFTTTHVRASLDNQPETIDFIEQQFGIDIRAVVV